MNMDNIPRSIFASVSKNFHDLSVEYELPMFIEGQKRDTRILPEFFELRIDGPDTLDFGSVLQFDWTINILIKVEIGSANYHRIHTIIGKIRSKFLRRLPIYEIPETIQEGWTYDDLEIIGCAALRSDHKNRDIRVFHFGQINPEILEQRASVVGSYRLTLDSN